MTSGDSSIQAMQALASAQRITAHNVANVNTDGFTPSRMHLEDGPGGEGVGVSAITRSGSTSWVGQGVAAPPETVQQEAAQAARRAQEAGPFGEPSGTEIAREMVSLIRNQRGFEANAVFFRNMTDTLGMVLDIKG